MHITRQYTEHSTFISCPSKAVVGPCVDVEMKPNCKIKYVRVAHLILFIAGIIGRFLFVILRALSNCSNIAGCNGAIVVGRLVGSIFIGVLTGIVWVFRVSSRNELYVSYNAILEPVYIRISSDRNRMGISGESVTSCT